jgi:protein XRP2
LLLVFLTFFSVCLFSSQVDFIENSTLFIGPCCESVFLRDCSNVTVTVACKQVTKCTCVIEWTSIGSPFNVLCIQLRTRDCSNVTIRLFCATDPIVESSHHVTFLPFNGEYPGLDDHFMAAGMAQRNDNGEVVYSENKWQNVFDFSSSDASLPKPHFEVCQFFGCHPWLCELPSFHPFP